ncbi:MAG: MarC family protein [Desulfurococcales archaeon]|nr:MarC family protein [Desulfurococcales archaeon]
MDLAELLKATLMLFVVLDPISAVPFYVTIASRTPPEGRSRLLRLIVLSVFSLLILFAVIGDYLFMLLGVTINDFRIAAGLILLVYAIASLFEIQIGEPKSSEGSVLVPLATPLLAGPGSVSVVIYLKYAYGPVTALLSTIICVLTIYPILKAGDHIIRLLGKHGILLLDKFMSLVIAGFAVSLIRTGLLGLL